MATVGTLTAKPDGAMTGRIRTRLLNLRIALLPAEKRGDSSPDFTVLEELADGATVEIGGAWKRTAERSGRYLSIALDDPSFPAPLNCSAFPQNSGDGWDVVWTRPREGRGA